MRKLFVGNIKSDTYEQIDYLAKLSVSPVLIMIAHLNVYMLAHTYSLCRDRAYNFVHLFCNRVFAHKQFINKIL